MKAIKYVGLGLVLVLSGCAKDGSYNGPKIWGTSSETHGAKTIWNTGSAQKAPATTLWKRSDGSAVVGNGASADKKDQSSD